jgi:hypothetical protein
MAACQKSHDIVLPYVISAVEVLVTVKRDAEYLLQPIARQPDFTALFKSGSFPIFLLCLCSEVGSFPASNPLNFMYRGHPDFLTSYTTFLHLIQDKIPIARSLYSWLTRGAYDKGEGSAELLISNPCSLNMKSPPSFSTRFRHRMENAIKRFTRNSHRREIVHSGAHSEDALLFSYLMKVNPCTPRLMQEIFRQTLTASRRTFVS